MERDNKLYLDLLPVCECGQVITNIRECECVGYVSSTYKFSTVEIKPIYCPFCGRKLKGFRIKNKYLDMFEE